MKQKASATFTVLLASACSCLHAGAATWEQTATARLAEEYDTNPAMATVSPGSVWRTIVEPGYTLTGHLDRAELRGGATLQMIRSTSETLAASRNNPTAFLEWAKFGDTSEMGLAARFTEIPVRNSDTDITGQIASNITRSSRTASARWLNSLSERTDFTLSAAHETVFYNHDSLVNFTSRSASATLKHAVSENHAPYLTQHFMDYQPFGSNTTSELFSTTAGWEWKLSPQSDINIYAGQYHSNSSDSATGTMGGTVYQYHGSTNAITLNVQRHAVASGTGGFVTLEQLVVNSTHELDENNRTGLDLSWQRNTLASIISRSETLWMQRDLNSFWSARLYFQHTHFDGSTIEGAATRIIGISFQYTYPDF